VTFTSEAMGDAAPLDLESALARARSATLLQAVVAAEKAGIEIPHGSWASWLRSVAPIDPRGAAAALQDAAQPAGSGAAGTQQVRGRTQTGSFSYSFIHYKHFFISVKLGAHEYELRIHVFFFF
jgi:hypothetical protein